MRALRPLGPYEGKVAHAAPQFVQYRGSDVKSPAVQISKVFNFQSYFDSTLLERAILVQRQNEPIVASTVVEPQLKGHMVGLHPSSQAPVALDFRAGERSQASQTYLLKPGEILRPLGDDPFEGFRFGLPFGWLGGGLVHLLIFQTPDADVLWHGNAELIFHRARYKINQPAELDAAIVNDAPFNWPLRFPWPHAFRAVTPQKGEAIVSIADPTRAIFVRRGFDSLANPADMRVIFQATNDFGLAPNPIQVAPFPPDVPILTDNPYRDMTWGTFTSVVVSGNLAKQNILQEMPPDFVRLAADDGGIVMVDISNGGQGGDLQDGFVDVVRYGRL